MDSLELSNIPEYEPLSDPRHLIEPEREPLPETEPKQISPEPEAVPEYFRPEPEFSAIEHHNTRLYAANVTNGTGDPSPEIFVEPEPPAMSQYYMPVMAGVAALLGLAIILENLLVLFVLLKGRPKRQPPSLTYCIGNLSVADLVAGIHLVWFICFDYFLLPQKPMMYTIAMCALWLVTIVASVVSLFNFALYRLKLAMSKESHPQSRCSAAIMISCSWLLPFVLLVVPPLVGWNCTYCVGVEYCRRQCSQVLFPFTKNYVLMLAILVLFAIASLFVVYVWMLRAVHQKVKKLKKKGSMKRKERSMIHTVMTILFLFTICILPVAVILIIDFFTIEYNPSLMTSFQIVSILSFINSVCNPFVYIWRLPSMKAALMKAFGRDTNENRNAFTKSGGRTLNFTKRKDPKSYPSVNSISISSGRILDRKTNSETTITSKK